MCTIVSQNIQTALWSGPRHSSCWPVFRWLPRRRPGCCVDGPSGPRKESSISATLHPLMRGPLRVRGTPRISPRLRSGKPFSPGWDSPAFQGVQAAICRSRTAALSGARSFSHRHQGDGPVTARASWNPSVQFADQRNRACLPSGKGPQLSVQNRIFRSILAQSRRRGD